MSTSMTVYAWYSPSKTYIQMRKVEPSANNDKVQISMQLEFGRGVVSPDVNLMVSFYNNSVFLLRKLLMKYRSIFRTPSRASMLEYFSETTEAAIQRCS